MSSPQSKIRFTPEEYLGFERASETKHEYINGYIYAMTGNSPLHNQICFNAAGLVGKQLKGSAHQGYVAKQCIRNDSLTLCTYPDVVIVFGEAKFHDQRQDVITNPKVIIEILTPVGESYERSERFPRYQQIKSLSEYVLISTVRPCVELFTRQKAKRQWLFSVETELLAELSLDSIGCVLKLADVYDRVVFPPRK